MGHRCFLGRNLLVGPSPAWRVNGHGALAGCPRGREGSGAVPSPSCSGPGLGRGRAAASASEATEDWRARQAQAGQLPARTAEFEGNRQGPKVARPGGQVRRRPLPWGHSSMVPCGSPVIPATQRSPDLLSFLQGPGAGGGGREVQAGRGPQAEALVGTLAHLSYPWPWGLGRMASAPCQVHENRAKLANVCWGAQDPGPCQPVPDPHPIPTLGLRPPRCCDAGREPDSPRGLSVSGTESCVRMRASSLGPGGSAGSDPRSGEGPGGS